MVAMDDMTAQVDLSRSERQAASFRTPEGRAHRVCCVWSAGAWFVVALHSESRALRMFALRFGSRALWAMCGCDAACVRAFWRGWPLSRWEGWAGNQAVRHERAWVWTGWRTIHTIGAAWAASRGNNKTQRPVLVATRGRLHTPSRTKQVHSTKLEFWPRRLGKIGSAFTSKCSNRGAVFT